MIKEYKSKVDIETVLEEVNKVGPHHVLQYTLALLPAIFTAISNGNYIFAAEAVNYRCIVPECENITTAMVAPTPTWWPSVTDLQCSSPILNNTYQNNSCTVNDFADGVRICDRWVYESQNSIVYEFDLACKEWKRTLVGTLHNIGMLISMPVLGYVSDRWGRRTAIICSAVGLATGALKTLAVGKGGGGYNLYVVLELLEASIGAAIYTSTFVLLVELGGQKRRVISTAILGVTIALGEVMLAVIAWLVPDWRQLLLVIYCPPLLFLSYVILLKESIRWLLINGKTKQAKMQVLAVAKMNNVDVSENVLTALDEGNVICDKETTTPIEEFSLKLLFSSVTLLKRLMLCSWWWFTAAFVYYGLMINSVSLPGNKHINFGLSALVAIPGDLIAMLVLDRFGRKKTLLFGYVFCGVCCVANGFIPKSATVIGLIMFLLGKAAISLCFNGVYVYTSELFPTSARSSLVGACSMFARIGSIISPLTPLLTVYWSTLPTILFGCTALTAAALMLLTPETLHQELPDTVAQAERLDKGKTFNN